MLEWLNIYLANNYIKSLNIHPIKVNYVVDGDTIKFQYINNWKLSRKYYLRFIWLDTPESNTKRYWHVECFWKEAKLHLKKILKNSNEEIEKIFFIEKDKSQWKQWRYGRELWYLLETVVNFNKDDRYYNLYKLISKNFNEKKVIQFYLNNVI